MLDLFQSKTLSYFLKMSEMGFRKELGTLPLQGAPSAAGFAFFCLQVWVLLGDTLGHHL